MNNSNSKLKDILEINQLSNTINEPTRVTDNSATCIDSIVISQSLHVLKSGILLVPTNMSDYRATYAVLLLNFNLDSYGRHICLYNKANFAKLNEMIEQTDWDYLHECNINDRCQNFTDTFVDLTNQCIPDHIFLIRLNDKPWFDYKLRKLIKKRDKIRKKLEFQKACMTGMIFKNAKQSQ